jgi:hypothetical protein
MKSLVIISVIILGAVCALNSAEGGERNCGNDKKAKNERNERALVVKWQRLVDEEGRTCDRCGSTEKELKKAFRSLKRSLAVLGMKVVLEKETLTPEECSKDISQSNRIWLGGKPLEEWLDAEVGKSLCGFCCEGLGDEVECRTVTIDGNVYETIPKELIIRAGLLAAAQLLAGSPTEPCCPQHQSGPGCC